MPGYVNKLENSIIGPRQNQCPVTSRCASGPSRRPPPLIPVLRCLWPGGFCSRPPRRFWSSSCVAVPVPPATSSATRSWLGSAGMSTRKKRDTSLPGTVLSTWDRWVYSCFRRVRDNNRNTFRENGENKCAVGTERNCFSSVRKRTARNNHFDVSVQKWTWFTWVKLLHVQ